MHAVSSVQNTMLRSEADWFPRFILICITMLHRMHECQGDYEAVRDICLCSSYREVRSIVKAYNDEDFENLIHMQEVLAKKAVARENGHKQIVG